MFSIITSIYLERRYYIEKVPLNKPSEYKNVKIRQNNEENRWEPVREREKPECSKTGALWFATLADAGPPRLTFLELTLSL